MTEIYGTFGPSCSNETVLEAMFGAGMTGVRLNLSHVSLRDTAEQIHSIKAAAKKQGRKAQLLIDMQGPELRIGPLREPLMLEDGEEVSADKIPFPEQAALHLLSGQQMKLDDGKILLEALPGRRLRVLRGGVLQSRKSLALPGVELRLPAITKADRENIAAAREFGITGLMQPFVRSREDLEQVRRELQAAGAEGVRIFAKIENTEGVDHLEELFPLCDEIVIARGDLGNAMPLWMLPAVQKEIAAACSRAGRRFMVVTQMLASMENNAVPTRAEVSDIFNAVLDGASSVMVTGESAVGRYPVEAIRYLARTAAEAERYLGREKEQAKLL